MTRDLIFTRYQRVRDDVGVPEARAWTDWIQVFSEHTLRGSVTDATSTDVLDRAKDGPCVVLGEIPEGLGHKNENVVQAHALGLDLDDIDDEGLIAVVKAIEPYEWVMYTTHKHAAPAVNGAIKVRAILPLEAPITPAQHKTAWRLLNKLVGNRSDIQTKNVGRVFFLPSTYDLSVAWSHHNEGRWISYADLVRDQGAPADRGGRTAGAVELLRTLEHSRPKDPEVRDLAKAVAAGKPLSVKGRRHDDILTLTLWLASRDGEPFDPDAFAEIFGPSIAATAARDGEGPSVEEIVTAYQGAIDKRAEWIEAQRTASRDAAMAAQAATAGGSYSDGELAAIAQTLGLGGDSPAVSLQRRWIVQKGAAYYLLAHDGGYRGPFVDAEARPAAVEILARAPVLLNEPSPQGIRRRKIQELVEDYGTVAVEVVVDLTLERSTYDARRRRMREASRPLRTDLVPEYNEHIAAWLRLMARDTYDKLCDWMACAPDLSKLLCAPYIAGHPGAGKTLFAMGMARLWSDTPGDLEAVLSDHNDEIVRCPLILADEEIPRGRYRGSITAKLRSMLSTMDRTLTRKYLPPAALHGAVRLIITANNEFLLSTKDAVSGQDLEAIAQRFLYIEAPEDATRYLEVIPKPERDRWLIEGIARHALWLHAHRTVTPGKRFWVEGDVSQMHRLLLISADWTSRVCEWLVRFLMSPKLYAQRNDGLVRPGKGRLFVNEQAILDGWKLYFPNTSVEPETAKVGMALRAISGHERPQMRWGGLRYRYREVLVDMLFGWSEAHGIGDRDKMLETLWDGETPPPEAHNPEAHIAALATPGDPPGAMAINAGDPF